MNKLERSGYGIPRKVKTVSIQGNQYAKVAERLKEFRESNPNGLIETEPTIREDGQVVFKAHILKDKADPNSAEATGHAIGAVGGREKNFEKLETVAVGRALALLGYAMDGEIASSDEMEEFFEQKKEKEEKELSDWTKKLEKCKTLDSLKKVWADMPVSVKANLKPKQEEMKAILTTEAKETV